MERVGAGSAYDLLDALYAAGCGGGSGMQVDGYRLEERCITDGVAAARASVNLTRQAAARRENEQVLLVGSADHVGHASIGLAVQHHRVGPYDLPCIRCIRRGASGYQRIGRSAG